MADGTYHIEGNLTVNQSVGPYQFIWYFQYGNDKSMENRMEGR